MDDEKHDDWLSAYSEQRKALIDYASKLTGARDVAEDIVQEAFLICLNKRDRNYEVTKAFLFTIVRNLAHNRRRHLAVRNAGHPDDLPWWAKHQSTLSPERQVLIIDQAKVAAQAIKKLPPKMRKVLELYRFDGLTLQEISARLDISVATAHRTLKESMAIIWKEMDLEG